MQIIRGLPKLRSRGLSFRQFCRELANDLNMEVVPPSMYESSCSVDDEDRVTSGEDAVQCITYNKREAFFKKLPLIERRMNRRAHHRRVSMKKQMSCIWCCRVDHSTAELVTIDTEERQQPCVQSVVSLFACDRDTMGRAASICSIRQRDCLTHAATKHDAWKWLSAVVPRDVLHHRVVRDRSQLKAPTKLLNHLILLLLTWLLVVQKVKWCHPLPHGAMATTMSILQDFLRVTTMTKGVVRSVASVREASLLFQSPRRGQGGDLLSDQK